MHDLINNRDWRNGGKGRCTPATTIIIMVIMKLDEKKTFRVLIS
jgi:hypothetical protein